MAQEHDAAQDFAERLVGVLNEGALALMLTIGHRTGLFDTMASLPRSTSEEIAKAAGLQERYVREWLGALVTGGIVEHDPAGMTFALPRDHARWLTRAAGPDNLALTTQYIGLLAQAIDPIVECFRLGGGLPYSAFPSFHAVMAEDSSTVHDATLLDVTLPLVTGLVERLRDGIDVADVGCGSGHALNLMAGSFPASRFVGFDIADEALDAGRAEARRRGLSNVRFEARDAATLDGPERFDFITTFDAIHDQARPDLALAGIAASLRPRGTYLCVDIKGTSTVAGDVELPLAPFLYTISTLHCTPVSLADGGLGLGTMWGERTAREMLAAAGFTSIELHEVEGDFVNNYYIATKD